MALSFSNQSTKKRIAFCDLLFSEGILGIHLNANGNILASSKTYLKTHQYVMPSEKLKIFN